MTLVSNVRPKEVRDRLPPPTPRDFRKVYTDYRSAFGRYPNLLEPKSFSEKIQWRKLFDLNPLYTVLADKIAARDFIASRVGAEWLVPLLWVGDSPEEIPFDQLKPPYILKCNHGSGYNIIVNDEATLDREKTREKLRKYLSGGYGWFLREPAYFLIRPRLLAEPLMYKANRPLPLERKLFVFDGYAPIVWTIFVDESRTRYYAFHTRDWKPLPWRLVNWPPYQGPDPRPEHLSKMLELAETIAAGFDHIRVDFYEWEGRLFVGELTLCTYSGLEPYEPHEADILLGSYWNLPHPFRRAVAPTLFGLIKSGRALIKRAISS